MGYLPETLERAREIAFERIRAHKGRAITEELNNDELSRSTIYQALVIAEKEGLAARVTCPYKRKDGSVKYRRAWTIVGEPVDESVLLSEEMTPRSSIPNRERAYFTQYERRAIFALIEYAAFTKDKAMTIKEIAIASGINPIPDLNAALRKLCDKGVVDYIMQTRTTSDNETGKLGRPAKAYFL